MRIALSYAINRAGDQRPDLQRHGHAAPVQPARAVRRSTTRSSRTPTIEFDQAKANELLDAAGYATKDAEGFRLWKDGSGTLSFTIESIHQTGDPLEDAAQTMVKYFADVGIKSAYKAVERSLYTEHYNANEIEAGFWGGDRTLLPLTAPIIFIGTQPDRPWSVAWGFWRTNPKDPNAEEPPADHFIRKIWDTVGPDRGGAGRDEAQRAVLPDPRHLGRGAADDRHPWARCPRRSSSRTASRASKKAIPIDDPTKDEHIINPQTLLLGRSVGAQRLTLTGT